MAISIFVPTPSVDDTIIGSFTFNFDKSKIEPKLPMFLNFLKLVFGFIVFFEIEDINFMNLSALEIFTPLFL